MIKRSLNTFILALFSLVFAGLLLTGCNSANPQAAGSSNNITTTAPQTAESPSTSPAPSAEGTPNSAAHSVTLTLYFPNSDGSGLIAAQRTVVLQNEEVIKAIFHELAAPPSGVAKPLPTGTTLLNATVKDGIATINLSPEFKENFNGGSAGELMTIYSIVDSLTSLSDVQSVQFLLNGKKENAILGSLDTSQPVKRKNSIIAK